MNSFRVKWLHKLAQTNTAQNPTVMPAPTVFVSHEQYPTIVLAFQNNSTHIDKLGTIINAALHYASGGEFDLKKLKDKAFNVDPSGVASTDAKNLLLISKSFFDNFLTNNGISFNRRLSPEEIKQRVDTFKQLQAFVAFPTTPTNNQLRMKMPDIKTQINNLLLLIK